MRFGLLAKLTLPAVALAVVGLGVTTRIGYTKSREAIESVVHQRQLQAVDSIARNARFRRRRRAWRCNPLPGPYSTLPA